jgi:dolichol-phosphate mannosyltransferase
MPVYNEEEGIVSFCEEIFQTFHAFEVEIIIVNDRSSDRSEIIIEKELVSKYPSKIKLISNEKNYGHGPSTLIGIHEAMKSSNVETIVTVDGDGQFNAFEILTLFKHHLNSNLDVIEGVRVNRQDPAFRKISTMVCKILVFGACRIMPRDANTCLRIYKPAVLKKIIKNIDSNSLIPNIFISTYTRLDGLNFRELDISALPRRASSVSGSTWRQKFTRIPSQRYLIFCLKATLQWVKTIYAVRKYRLR